MRENSETVREVCAEMRKELNQSWWDVNREKVHDIPDRILSAHEREMAEKEKDCAEIHGKYIAAIKSIINMKAGIVRLVTDCNRLKAALKPVMECRIERIDGLDSPDGEFMTSSEYGVCDADGNEVDNHSIASALNAVREAQRIMKEGEENDK